MFINKRKNGYSWYSKVVSKDKEGNEQTGYINFSFKKECEPTNLNEKGSYEGDLYFIDKDGNKRRIFPIAEYYNGLVTIDFKLLESNKEEVNNDRSKKVNNDVEVTDDDLPFY